MDHIKILKRAWAILWQYRVLWIFGIILALTTSSGANGSNTGYAFDRNDTNLQNFWTAPEDMQQQFDELFRDLERIPSWRLEEIILAPLLAIGIGFACVILLLVVVGIIARNVSEAALIRLVDDYEQTGKQKTFREGFRLGWSKAAVRLFLINLSAAIPLILVFVLLGALTLAPLLLWISGNPISGAFGTISTIGLGFLLILFFIFLGVAVKLLLHIVRRASAIEDMGVVDAYKKGFGLLRENVLGILLMWLIMLGIQLGSALIMIPVVLISLVTSGVISGLMFLIARGLTGLFLSGVAMWLVAGIVTLPIFILVLTIPIAFLGGLWKVFESSVWTLTYREISSLQAITNDVAEVVVVEPEDLSEEKVDEELTESEEDE